MEIKKILNTGNARVFITVITFILLLFLLNTNINISREINEQFYDSPEILMQKSECINFLENMSGNSLLMQEVEIQHLNGNTVCHAMVGEECIPNIGIKKTPTSDLKYPYIEIECEKIVHYKVNLNEYIKTI